jgi:uncharacterized membrane protein HdeD (DUF308 family)
MSEEENVDKKKTPNNWAIVCYNILALVFYTLLFRFIDGGIFLDCFFVGIHFLTCIVLSIVAKKWEWVLSAFLVLAIGFSTCVTYLDVPNMH